MIQNKNKNTKRRKEKLSIAEKNDLRLTPDLLSLSLKTRFEDVEVVSRISVAFLGQKARIFVGTRTYPEAIKCNK